MLIVCGSFKNYQCRFQSTEVWFTDQNNRPLIIETNVNITRIIETYQFEWDIQLNQEKENMLNDSFLSFTRPIWR